MNNNMEKENLLKKKKDLLLQLKDINRKLSQIKEEDILLNVQRKGLMNLTEELIKKRKGSSKCYYIRVDKVESPGNKTVYFLKADNVRFETTVNTRENYLFNIDYECMVCVRLCNTSYMYCHQITKINNKQTKEPTLHISKDCKIYKELWSRKAVKNFLNNALIGEL